jgi:Tfp pilus assembly protein PilF
MRGRLRVLPLFCAFLIALIHGACPKSLSAQNGPGSIVGQIRIAPGNEIKAPVLVNLSSRGATITSVYTDNEGRFGFNGLPGNIYHILVNEDGYLPVENEVSVDPVTSSMRIVNIYLVPLDSKAKTSPSVNGGNTRLAGSTQFTQQIPKPARKEYDRGVRSDKDGKPDEAIAHYQKAVELAPEFYEARNNLGSDLLSKSKFPEAREQFEKVVTVNPSDAAAYFNLANLSLLTQQYDQGQRWVEQGLSKQPDSAFGQFLQGSLYDKSGKPGEAEVALKRCLELDPFMSKAHLALVNLYLQQKRESDAASELRLFLKNFPEDPFAPRAKQVLQKLETVSGNVNP